MSKRNDSPELDKSQRIKKHDRGHTKTDGGGREKRLKPNHQPAKKQHINILDAYEKFGEDCEDVFNE